MALFGREFIAVPDDRKNQIVFKWPDVNIRKMSRAIVDADEWALFVNKGQVVGTLPPGQHQIDADELPFLGIFIDHATGGNAYRAELYFVGTREYTGQTFGGRIDDVQDPQTGMIVTLRVFGDFALKVADPAKIILNLTGTVDVSNNDAITGWVADQLLKVMRTTVTQQIVRNGWPILGLSAYTPDLEQAVLEAGNGQIEHYGLTMTKMGNFDINLSEEDETQLKGLAKDTAYSRLAGNFNAYAAGEAALGAGQGMAKGGGSTGGAFLAAGLGLGQQVTSPQPGAGAPPPAAPGFAGGGPGFAGGGGGAAATVACASCGTANPPGAKFCSSCGTALAPTPAHCTNCGAELAHDAKFCAACGHAVSEPAPVPAGGASTADAAAPAGAAVADDASAPGSSSAPAAGA